MTNNRFYSVASFFILLFSTIVLTGCPSGGGGGGGGTSNTGGVTFDIGDVLPFRMVTLDYNTGTLPAGSHVPLACVSGGFITGGGELNCPPPHLHGTIGILGIGSPFSDPNDMYCGFGQVGFTSYNMLSYRCNHVENASLTLIVDEYSAFTLAFVSLFLPGVTTPAQTINITDRLSVGGSIPVEESAGGTYDRMAIYTACFRGFNSTTGENEYVHQKFFVDLNTTFKKYLKLDCTPYANYITSNLNLALSNEYSGGEFRTGGRSMGQIALTAGVNNPLMFDSKPATTRTGMVIGYNLMGGWDGAAFSYDPNAAGNFDANSSTLDALQDTNVDDSTYMGQSDYEGLRIYGKAPGLFQAYYTLDGTTPPAGSRNLPTVPSLGSVGGIHKIQARFGELEPVTNREQSVTINKYSVNPVGGITFNETRANYLSQGDVNTVNYISPTISGFTLGLTYDPGITGQDPVKVGVRAETLDSSTTTPTRHFWRGDYYAGFSEVDMGFATDYLDDFALNTGITATPPTDAGITQIRLSYSNKLTVAQKYSMYNKWPLAEKEGEVSFRMSYKY